MSMSTAAAPRRLIHHGDALAWLRAHRPLEGASVVTSLPDVSELQGLGLAGWRAWFIDAAELTLRSVTDEGVVIFFQSDIRHGGVWIDKGQLIATAAERSDRTRLFHTIVCRLPPGAVSSGRASYAHLLGFGRAPRAERRASADVIADGGFVPGRKAMGVNACLAACRYVLDQTPTRTVVDPFCGWGTVLAVANALGLDAVGVDISARMCSRARKLHLELEGAR
jgi:hypothetical protein